MRIMLLILSLSTCGCGTLANVAHSKYLLFHTCGEPIRVYGGVRNDFEYVSEMVKTPVNEDGDRNMDDDSGKAPILNYPIAVIPVAYFLVVDPVLSFVADTLTLPRVLSEQRAERLSGVEQVGSKLPD